MVKILAALCFTFCIGLNFAQEATLVNNIQYQNLTLYNASLINPTYSFDLNQPRSFALWSRWQQQDIDADPTALFANYTQKLGNTIAGGLGFFQNNTDRATFTGGVMNVALTTSLNKSAQIRFGSNVMVYQTALGGITATDPALIDQDGTLRASLSPALGLKWNGFNASVILENALGFNFSDGSRNSGMQNYLGMLAQDFAFGQSYLRPTVYGRIYGEPLDDEDASDLEYGLQMLFRNPKFWLQGGYNNLYGASGGLGVTLFKKLSLGGLVEFDLDTEEDPLQNSDLSFEIVAAFFFGAQEFEPREPEEEEEPSAAEKLEQAEAERLAQEQREAEAQRQAEEAARKAEEERLAQEQAAEAELRKAQQAEEAAMLAADVIYQEDAADDNLASGFYLIVGVFGNTAYRDRFLKNLRGQGLSPEYFLRSSNQYNYVYLAHFSSFNEALAARNSGFEGRYGDRIWIYAVR
ncbi:MAG: type IX secretion system membrane protein PorP/SprF [Bacteroidota bacterium]